MPWKKSDVKSHIKGLDDKQQQAWVSIANSTLTSCLADGGDQKDCEGKAIRIANAMSKEVKESVSELTEVGKTISAATEGKIRAAISALEELLAQTQEEADLEVESQDAMALEEEHIELIERAIGEDGLAHIRLIAPGWGTSGYYSPQLLERDGPKVFREGLHMHLDHQTAAEAKARPEGSTKDLAGVLASDARWEPSGPVGPGLYADAKVFEPYRPLLNEMAPHIGVSIRANGRAVRGEAEGRKGNIIEAITAANTTDYVTRAGAGGMIVPLAESTLNNGIEIHLFESRDNKLEAEVMDAEELRALQEAKAAVEAENARLKETLLLREAQDVVREALVKVDMPALTRTRLADTLAKNPPVAEGKLDTEALETQIQEAVRVELEYIAQISGAGKVRGMGAGGGGNGSTDLRESFRNMYARQGKSPEEAEKLAALASAGR